MTDPNSGSGRPPASWQRPYLEGASTEPLGDGSEPGVSRLRPYLLTSGRVEPVDHTLEIEAQVMTSTLGASSYGGLAFEQRDIVALCQNTLSVAEIAAKLRLHVGVARVLVGDLAAAGYLVVSRPGAWVAQDKNMIERVIRGLEAIR